MWILLTWWHTLLSVHLACFTTSSRQWKRNPGYLKTNPNEQKKVPDAVHCGIRAFFRTTVEKNCANLLALFWLSQLRSGSSIGQSRAKAKPICLFCLDMNGRLTVLVVVVVVLLFLQTIIELGEQNALDFNRFCSTCLVSICGIHDVCSWRVGRLSKLWPDVFCVVT